MLYKISVLCYKKYYKVILRNQFVHTKNNQKVKIGIFCTEFLDFYIFSKF